MICPICKQETIRIRTFYKEGVRIEGCYTCTNQYMTGVDSAFVHAPGQKSKITVRHKKEMMKRVKDPISGEVKLNYGKKYFY